MVATPVVLETSILNPSIRSLEDWMQNPPDGTEWVDGKLIAKHPEWVDGELIEPNGMTLKHSQVRAKMLPQSFPLSAEIVSPTDFAEDMVAKAEEYLQSGGEEVWLVFPESRWVSVVTSDTKLIFASGEVAETQKVLLGFEVEVDALVGCGW
jgi:Putative restriction endonuclease